MLIYTNKLKLGVVMSATSRLENFTARLGYEAVDWQEKSNQEISKIYKDPSQAESISNLMKDVLKLDSKTVGTNLSSTGLGTRVIVYDVPKLMAALEKFEKAPVTETETEIESIKAKHGKLKLLQERLIERFQDSKIGPIRSAELKELEKIFDFIAPRHSFTVRLRSNPADPGFTIETVDNYDPKRERIAYQVSAEDIDKALEILKQPYKGADSAGF